MSYISDDAHIHISRKQLTCEEIWNILIPDTSCWANDLFSDSCVNAEEAQHILQTSYKFEFLFQESGSMLPKLISLLVLSPAFVQSLRD